MDFKISLVWEQVTQVTSFGFNNILQGDSNYSSSLEELFVLCSLKARKLRWTPRIEMDWVVSLELPRCHRAPPGQV